MAARASDRNFGRASLPAQQKLRISRFFHKDMPQAATIGRLASISRRHSVSWRTASSALISSPAKQSRYRAVAIDLRWTSASASSQVSRPSLVIRLTPAIAAICHRSALPFPCNSAASATSDHGSAGPMCVDRPSEVACRAIAGDHPLDGKTMIAGRSSPARLSIAAAAARSFGASTMKGADGVATIGDQKSPPTRPSFSMSRSAAALWRSASVNGRSSSSEATALLNRAACRRAPGNGGARSRRLSLR